MENKIFFGKYQAVVDAADMPIEIRRSAGGTTIKAQEINSGRGVALELVAARRLDPEMREKIEADANAMKQINHVNIPALYDFGFDNGDLVYVTELVEGTTADSWVTTHGPMPVRAVLRVALQVVSALAAAAFQLVTHRAIHPGNILIVPGQTAEGEWPMIKVLNFGRIFPRARASGDGAIRDKSAPFASPEQLAHGTVDFRSEIYSLGCTLWSLLTGVSPFNAPGQPLAAAQMAPAMKRFKGVPKKIRRLISEMVATNPDERPLDPVVMTQLLEETLAHVDRREALARKFGIPATWQRRRRVRPAPPLLLRPASIGAMLLALAAISAAFLTRSPRPLWKKFTYQEPIGVPIGVPETAVGSTAKANSRLNATTVANANNANRTVAPSATTPPAPAVAPPPVVAAVNRTSPNEQPTPDTTTAVNSAPAIAANPPAAPPPPAESNASVPEEQTTPANFPPSPGSETNVAAAGQNNVAVIPAPTSSPNEQTTSAVAPPSTNSETNIAGAGQNTVAVIPAPAAPPNEQNAPPGSPSFPDVASASHAASANAPSEKTPPVEPPRANDAPLVAGKVPRAELVEPPPNVLASKKRVARSEKEEVVPRAELIEPPPPAEGTAEMAANSSDNDDDDDEAASEKAFANVPRAELVEPPPASAPKTTTARTARRDAQLTPAERAAIRKASRRTRYPKVTAEGDGASVRLPNGVVHARFIGTTPDGQWMLALPSRRIMIVPPPSNFTPR